MTALNNIAELGFRCYALLDLEYVPIRQTSYALVNGVGWLFEPSAELIQ